MYTFIGLGVPELLIILSVLGGIFVVFPLVALIEVIRSDFRGQNDKLTWVIIILFLNLIGAVRTLVLAVAAVAIAVSALSVFNTLLAGIIERTTELADGSVGPESHIRTP